MQIRKVQTKADWQDFHQVQQYIYAKDPHWIFPLQSDVEDVFNPEKNKTFEQGEAECWVLYSNNDQPIGRIAAFIDGKRNAKKGIQQGGLGYFECINNDEAAAMLFAQGEAYLQERGMQSVEAPVNFGERDKFWGLLVQGWHPPLYHENYQPAYYQRFFTQNDYREQDQILTFGGSLTNVELEEGSRGFELAKKVRKRYKVQSRAMRKKDLEKEAEHVTVIYNEAFKHFPHFKPLQPKQTYQMFKAMKPVMDENLTCIAFADGQPVGFCALMPDLNPLLAFAKGKLNWWKLPRFLWNLRFQRPQIIKGVAFGIVPDFQRRGVFSEMVEFMWSNNNFAIKRKYSAMGLATIRGHNAVMIKTVAAGLGSNIERVHLAYQKILDPEITFQQNEFTDVSEVPMGDVPDEGLYPES